MSRSGARSAAKRAFKRNPKAFIIIVVAIILIAVTLLVVFRFAFPDRWNAIFKGEQESPLVYGDGDLAVHFLDVGQGDCIYIEFPDNTDMVIDCGNDCDYLADVKEYIDRYDDDGTIDHLMLTHSDQDHVDHLDEIINDYVVKNIYMPNILAEPSNAALKERVNALDQDKLAMFTDDDTISTKTYANFFIAALSEPDCTIHLNMDDDENTNNIVIENTEYAYSLTFYCPTKAYYDATGLGNDKLRNAVSPIGILSYNGRRIVLTGDSNELNEPTFVRRIGQIDCDVLKVGHHGSETSSTQTFLAAIKCEYAVISCNEIGNTYFHPRQAALDRMKALNMTVFRTDNDGTILLTVSSSGALTFHPSTPNPNNFIGADQDFD